MVNPQSDIKEPQQTTEDSPIVDGEIVEEVPSENVTSEISTDADQSTVLLSLEELIKSHITSLDRLQEEKRKLTELIADGFNNDAAFKQVSDKVKEVNKEKSAIRQQIMNRAGIIEIANKLKDIKSELKEKQVSLSDYLLEYQRMAGVNEIETADGDVREIIQVAKLIKKAKKDK